MGAMETHGERKEEDSERPKGGIPPYLLRGVLHLLLRPEDALRPPLLCQTAKENEQASV